MDIIEQALDYSGKPTAVAWAADSSLFAISYASGYIAMIKVCKSAGAQ